MFKHLILTDEILWTWPKSHSEEGMTDTCTFQNFYKTLEFQLVQQNHSNENTWLIY